MSATLTLGLQSRNRPQAVAKPDTFRMGVARSLEAAQVLRHAGLDAESAWLDELVTLILLRQLAVTEGVTRSNTMNVCGLAMKVRDAGGLDKLFCRRLLKQFRKTVDDRDSGETQFVIQTLFSLAQQGRAER